MTLDPVSLRVLGALMEKEMTTPESYPLSVNALVAAANQRSSRDPVMTLEEGEVRSALSRLEEMALVAAARDGGRVARFEHRIRTVLALRRDETAVLCLLLLRGPQTPGELRSRSERMFAFDDLPQAQATLDRMAAREQPLAVALPRAPGSRETRYAHLLGGPVAAGDAAQAPAAQPTSAAALEPAREERAANEALEARVQALEETAEELGRRLARLEAALGGLL